MITNVMRDHVAYKETYPVIKLPRRRVGMDILSSVLQVSEALCVRLIST